MASSYADEDVERALQAVVVTGSATEASRALEEHQGVEIPPSTISSWMRDTHRKRYLAIREEVGPKLRELIAAQSEDLALTIGEIEQGIVDKINAELGRMSGKDAAFALKALSESKSKAIDKALLLRGEPTQIVHHRDPVELFRELAQMGAKVTVAGEVIEGTAREVKPAELPAQSKGERDQ